MAQSSNALSATQHSDSLSASKSSSSSSSSVNGKATQFTPADRISSLCDPTVWHHFTPLALQSSAVNLGQGFPGFSPPSFVVKAAERALNESGDGRSYLSNQYARSAGDMELTKVLAEKYSKKFSRNINPETEILIQNGASGALFNAFAGLINPGDEVIAFEPVFDLYIAQVVCCGGILKPVPLHPRRDHDGKQHWKMDEQEVKEAFSEKTRMIVLNTPQNPTGKVFDKSELDFLCNLVLKHPNCIVLSDEVYEHLTYMSSLPHLHIATFPSMYERTLTISSSGKTFSCTGWKIGYVIGPQHLIRPISVMHQWNSFSICTPLQQCIADSLKQAEYNEYNGEKNYYIWLNKQYLNKRKLMINALEAAGLEPIEPEGSFFIIADTSNIDIPEKYLNDSNYPNLPRDWAFCRWLTLEIGVAAIPPSSFYSENRRHLAKNLARFAFCKTDEMLQEAAKRLLKVRQFLKK